MFLLKDTEKPTNLCVPLIMEQQTLNRFKIISTSYRTERSASTHIPILRK